MNQATWTSHVYTRIHPEWVCDQQLCLSFKQSTKTCPQLLLLDKMPFVSLCTCSECRVLNSGRFRGGSWGSMEPPFGLDLVIRSTDDRLNGTPLSG